MTNSDFIPPHASQPPLLDRFIDRPFDDIALRDYYYAISQTHGCIRFIGLPIGRDSGRPVDLEKLYVEPLLTTQWVSPEEVDASKKHTPFLSVLCALRDHQRIIVLGDPGAGKSTLIHWLADTFSSPEPHQLTTTFGRLIPIPIVLRDLRFDHNLKMMRWEDLFSSFLEQPIAQSLKLFPKKKLDAIFETGQALVLLDGLDEVPYSLRESVRHAVWQGFSQFSRCRWVLTSRVVGYDQCPFHSLVKATPRLENSTFHPSEPVETSSTLETRFKRQAFATVLFTAPFNNEQLSLFAHNWYRAYEPVLSAADRSARDFLDAVRSNRGIRALARIPNLVTLMALIYRQYARLPDGRAVLYEKIVEAYLESIDEARRLKFSSTSPLSRIQKERWLAEVAFQMQLRRPWAANDFGALMITRKDLLDSLAKFISENSTLVKGQEVKLEAARLLDVIAERSGLLLPRGGSDLFAFVHLSFQEYFAALYLRRTILARGWEEKNSPDTGPTALKKYTDHNTSWTESILLLFELLSEQEGWPEHLVEVLFEQELQWENPTRSTGITYHPMALLIAISLDSHTGLSMTFRRRIWTAAWRGLIQTSGFEEQCAGDPARLLLQPSDYREQVLQLGAELVTTGRIRELHINDANKYPELLELINPSPLEVIHLSGWQITPELSKRLISLQRLRHLSLDGTADAANLLMSLPRLNSLTLKIRNTATKSDKIWKAVASLIHLETFTLSDSHEGELSEVAVHLGFLSNQQSLRKLSLFRVNVVDLSPLQKNPKLEEIYLDVADSKLDLSPLCHVPNLREIYWTHQREPIELSSIADKVKIFIPKKGKNNWENKRWFPFSRQSKKKSKKRISA
ncbi:MAG TPA: NACHT domain-containing protein [Candidatus Sulfotelmatobacter sp.]|jgi:internalin A|nr:NACHT domain-containing protein [Candidatus Sulfotelmatobacter sp.]